MKRRGAARGRGFGSISPEEEQQAEGFFGALIGRRSHGGASPRRREGEDLRRAANSGTTGAARTATGPTTTRTSTGTTTTTTTTTTPPGFSLPSPRPKPYTPTTEAQAHAAIFGWLNGRPLQYVWQVQSAAHRFFPHRSVGLIHASTHPDPGQGITKHANCFVFGPDRLMTSANALVDSSTNTPLPYIRVMLGWDGVNPPAATLNLTGSAVRLYPPFATGSSGAPDSVGVLKLPAPLRASFRPFALTAQTPLPQRLATIAYHVAGGPTGHQCLHIGNPITQSAQLFTTRVFKWQLPPVPGGRKPFEGGPTFDVQQGPNPAMSWRVYGIINDVDPFLGATANSPDLQATVTRLTTPKIQWALSVT